MTPPQNSSADKAASAQTTQPSLQAPKPQWRKWAMSVRGELPNQSQAVTKRTAALLRELGANTVLLYHALPGEPDLSGLGGGFRLLTTRARVKPTRRLTLHAWDAATERSPVGVMQPPKDTPEVALEEVDAVVLPGIAFDRAGFRLGYGGGFYDRFLARVREQRPVPAIGVTFGALLLEAVPRESHDVPLDYIVTEGETWQAQRRAGAEILEGAEAKEK